MRSSEATIDFVSAVTTHRSHLVTGVPDAHAAARSRHGRHHVIPSLPAATVGLGRPVMSA